MPLPENLSTVTVTATYEEADGSLASGGSVTFDPGPVITARAGKVIFGRPATAPVVAGQIEITLPATDNEDLNPTGFTYTVTENVSGWPARAYQVELPSSLGPAVDLSELSPAADPPPPTEQAGGDLSGPYANPVVIRTHLAEPLPAAQGGTGLAAAGDPGTVLTSGDDGTVSWQDAAALPAPPALGLAADAGISGVPLGGDAAEILSWTAPDDGRCHLVCFIIALEVTAAASGGQVTAGYTNPWGGTVSAQLLAAGQAASTANSVMHLVAPGTVVTVAQATPLTAGAAVLWAQVWAA